MLENAKIKLPLWEAVTMVIILLVILSGGIIYMGLSPHLPMMLSLIVLLLFGLFKKVSMEEMQQGIVSGAASGLGAVYLFFFIGMLVSSWMASGTIPTLMYAGFDLFSDVPIYFSAFFVCAIIGTSIGSAFTTVASVGVAFLGMAMAMDASLAIAAGAVVSGAFLGDKMSPLSDTTNLASETVGVQLFDHIKNMMWTTLPGLVIAGALYFILSPDAGSQSAEVSLFMDVLREDSYIHWSALLPFAVLVILAVRRVSAMLTLSAGIISAMIVTFLWDGTMTFSKFSTILYSGFVMESKVEQLNSVLSRGGIESMMNSISLVMIALGLGGLLFTLGIIPAILTALESKLKSVSSLILATGGTAIGINFFVGEQYLSILLPGKTFEGQYQKMGYEKKVLSRVLEDTGTVVNPLVPWGVCGVFLTGVLGVSTMEYGPFAFFCLLCPVLTFISGLTHIGISQKTRTPLASSRVEDGSDY
ncbi:MAG: Na+/H+ antiporter NhaC [Bacillus sp. (in: firmicutes)]